MSLLKTFTFTMVVDVDIDGEVPNQEIKNAIIDKILYWRIVYNKDNYVFINYVELELRKE